MAKTLTVDEPTLKLRFTKYERGPEYRYFAYAQHVVKKVSQNPDHSPNQIYTKVYIQTDNQALTPIN